jgi:hypothetical protein
MIEAVRPLLTRIQRTDRSLADQLRRAASVALDICEEHMSGPGEPESAVLHGGGQRE